MEILISVIIPVYNASEYIEACVESILTTGYTALEIICVDDGSTDDSAAIIAQLQQEDSRIRLFSQHNQGVSVARNKGLSLANGAYITFIDADDRVAAAHFEVPMNDTPDALFATQFFNRELLEGVNRTKVDYNKSEIITCIIPLYLQTESNNSVCNKFYKNEIIRRCNIKFPEGMPLGEDGYFNVSFLLHATSLVIFENNTYVYQNTPDSATKNLKKHNYLKSFIDGKDRYSGLLRGEKLAFPKANIERWSNVKLLRNIQSIMPVYFRTQPDISLKERMRMVKEVLQNEKVRYAMLNFGAHLMDKSGWFDKMVFKAIKSGSLLRLRLLYKYSNYRNGIK